MDDKDWKLKLRYGKLITPYKHFTLLADGVAGELIDGFQCRPGKAWMAMKVWAENPDEAADVIRSVGHQIGFMVSGRIEIYDTEPAQPPAENPYGYDIGFHPYQD